MNEREIDAIPPRQLDEIKVSGERIGYRRVSTGDQTTERQLDELKDTLDRIFEDKLSGKDRNRPGLNECLTYLRKGDVLFVHSIDRLARNLSDLQSLVATIVDKGAAVSFSKENLHFTAEKSDNMGKLLMQILGAFAEFERSMIKERQKEGIKLALERGVKFGRKNAIDEDIAADIETLLEKNISKTAIAKACGISRQTLYNYLKSLSG